MIFDALRRTLTLKLWCALMAVLAVLLVVRWQQGIVLETNILALLPATEQDPVVEHASVRFNDALARRHLLLVGADQLETAIAAADQLAEAVRQLPGVETLDYRFDAQHQRAILAPYLDHHSYFLSRDSRQLLASGGQAYLDSTFELMYSPMTPLSSALLQRDPLLLFYRFATGLSEGFDALTLQRGVLTAESGGRHYVMLALRLADSPFSLTLQQTMLPALDAAIAQLRETMPAVEVLNVGVARFASAGVESAKREISTIGIGSLIGVVVLFVLVFRSPLPLLYGLLPIAVGFVAALTACQWVFGTVHLLTLVFGASLIGISIDYSFHFFCDRLAGTAQWTGAAGVKRIFNGITLGLVTSVLGFLGLCFAPFPGMQQMALFSTVGLAAAFVTVVCLFPVLVNRAPSPRRGVDWVALAGRLLTQLQWPRAAVAVSLLLVGLLAVAGVWQLHSNDDIRLLQSAPPALRAEEQRAAAILGAGLSNQFLLVEGGSAQQVLQQEEAVLPALRVLQVEGRLQRFDALSQRLPSAQRQRENRSLVAAALLTDPALLQRYADRLGLSPQLLQDAMADYRQPPSPPPSPPLSLQDWLQSAAGEPWRHLWLGQTDRGYASVIVLYGADTVALQGLEQATPGVTLVDKVNDISALLKQYRQRAAVLVALSYALIFVLLCPRYGVKRAINVLLPPLMAVLVVLGVLGWTGQSINIFHLLALLLVLGIGVDYTLFLEEGRGHRQPTLLAIVLSALTTLLSFGLLALSETAAVSAFGIVVLIGVMVCVVLAPMLCGRDRADPVDCPPRS